MDHLQDSGVDDCTATEREYLASVERLRRDTVRRVRDDLQAQPAAVVQDVLLERLRGRLPGVDIDTELMRHVAWAIEHGRVVERPPLRASS
jgi:hypothetical protein